MSSLTHLGDPIQYHVLPYLPFRHIINLTTVCNEMKAICQNEITYSMLLQRDFNRKSDKPKEDYVMSKWIETVTDTDDATGFVEICKYGLFKDDHPNLSGYPLPTDPEAELLYKRFITFFATWGTRKLKVNLFEKARTIKSGIGVYYIPSRGDCRSFFNIESFLVNYSKQTPQYFRPDMSWMNIMEILLEENLTRMDRNFIYDIANQYQENPGDDIVMRNL